MKWLVTFSPRYRRCEVYLGWIARAGIAGTVHRTDDPTCPSPAGFDALLLSGGGDVEPACYGATPESETGGVDPERDRRETALIEAFIGAGKPVFGICRGIQILNVTLGGALIQHVPRRLAGQVPPETHAGPDETDAIHKLVVDTNTRLGAALGAVDSTNSMHHQAVEPGRLARGLRPTAWSGQGIIEAVEGCGDGGAILEAVQWHPERLPPEHPAAGRLLEHWHALSGTARN